MYAYRHHQILVEHQTCPPLLLSLALSSPPSHSLIYQKVSQSGPPHTPH